VIVLPLDLSRFRKAAPAAAALPLFEDLAPILGAAAGQPSIREALLAAESGPERQRILESAVRAEIGAVVGLAPKEVDPHGALGRLGLDSLMALQIRNRLEASLDLELPATFVWRFRTVAAMVPHLAELMDLPGLPPGGDPAAATPPDGQPAPAEQPELESLSPEDLAALLARELARGNTAVGTERS
ncbi:MAG: acyl carrier protein, partial [Chloroflexota bacterium]